MIAGLVVVQWAGKHDRLLCVRCAAAVPENPAQRSEDWRWCLFTVHRLLVALFVPLIVGLFVVNLFVDVWATEVFLLLNAFMTVAIWRHKLVIPWCPYCQGWGDGGDDEVHDDVPDPVPSGEKTQ